MRTKVLMSMATGVLLLASMGGQQAAAQNANQNAAPATNWKQIAIPELPAFTPKEPKRVVLPNGMIVFLTENHELPLISGSAKIRGGADSEPADKTGLVEMYGATWRTGGTEKLTGDQLDDMLEARAAKVETGGGDDDTSVNFNCLKADFPDVLAIVVELLRTPAFREDKLSLAKKEMNSSISRRNDESDDIAQMQTDILGYGKKSAYARVPEYATVAAVTREDLLRWHKEHTTPNNIIFGVVGDFDSKQMEATLRKAFDSWPKGEKAAEPKIAIDPEKPGIYVVDKNDVNQSEIRMISLGIERRNPDYYAVQVMNEIFGGGFSSRLFSNLRTKAGLAYSVGGGVGSNWDHQGLTVLQIGTKTETTVEAIQGLWDQLELMKKDAPTEAEMKRAKDAILNSFIFNFDTPAKVLREQETYEFYGYPHDFLQRYRAGVEKVTKDDVLRVASKYLHKDELKVLVIGNASDFDKQLAALGTVTPVDITIPGPVAKNEAGSGSQGSVNGNPNSNPVSNAEGKAAVAKLLDKVGGAAKVNGVKTVRQSFSMMQQGAEIVTEENIVYPDKEAQRIGLPQGELLQVVTPEAAFMAMGDHVQELAPVQRASDVASLKRDMLNVLQHTEDAKYTFSAAGKEKLDDGEAVVVDVNADGTETRWWIDGEGKLVQEEYSDMGREGPETVTVKYSDWKDFGGLKLPAKFELSSGEGEDAVSMTMTALEVNATIDPKLFEKPQQ
jgi:zinc protease